MLLDLRQVNQIFLVCGKTDLRRGIDGLADVVQQQFELAPYQKALFLFCRSLKDRSKGLLWADNGFLLLLKGWKTADSSGRLIQASVRKLQPKQLERLLLSGWALDSNDSKP